MAVNSRESSINDPSYDLVILGSGTTAFAAARRASGLGRRVLMLEHSQLGGTCVNWGCIPSKTLVDKAELYFSARRGDAWGLNLSAAFPDCPKLMEVKQRVVETLRRDNTSRFWISTRSLTCTGGTAGFSPPGRSRSGRISGWRRPGWRWMKAASSSPTTACEPVPRAFGPPLVAPACALEAEVAVDDMFNAEWGRVVDHRHTPMAIFVSPELATVGITAEQAAQEGLEAEQTWLGLEQVAKAHVMGETRGGILLCAEKGSGRLLGVQILAPRASEVIHEATLALRCGLRVSELAASPHVYPSIADGLRLAAMEHLRLHGVQGAVRVGRDRP